MKARIGFVQFCPVFGTAEENLETILRLVKKAKKPDLVVLPELCLTGYQFANRKEQASLALAQEKTRWTEQLSEWCRKKNSALLAGFLEKSGKSFFDSALFLTPFGPQALYRKAHLFFREKKWFLPGNSGSVLVEWRKVRYGIGICLDYLFPEYWRKLAMQKADVFCLPANLVTDNGQPLMNARSRENRVYSIIANRTGIEREIPFCGNSQVIAPNGKILAQLKQKTGIKVVEIDINAARNKFLLAKNGAKYNHVLNDRRPELYGVG